MAQLHPSNYANLSDFDVKELARKQQLHRANMFFIFAGLAVFFLGFVEPLFVPHMDAAVQEIAFFASVVLFIGTAISIFLGIRELNCVALDSNVPAAKEYRRRHRRVDTSAERYMMRYPH